MQNNIPEDQAAKAIEAFLKAGIYTEFYTVDDYFIQDSQASDITKKHKHVIGKNPVQVKSLVEESKRQKVTKIMPIAIDENDKSKVEKVFKAAEGDIVLSWGVHPVILPLQFGIVTAPGISKKQGAIEISKSLNIPFKNILGVGDSTSDWQFIKLCGYGAAMGNASQELKDNVLTKGMGKSYIAPSVDENGILKVISYFKLLK